MIASSLYSEVGARRILVKISHMYEETIQRSFINIVDERYRHTPAYPGYPAC